MKAIVKDRYGPPEVLRVADVEPPLPRDREVLVSVAAAGVDPGVWHLLTGSPYLVRLGTGLRRPRTRGCGRDLAGTVTAVGAKVTRFRPGDRVFGTCRTGSFAEFAAAPEKHLAALPDGVPMVEAAALPVSGLTALHAVRAAEVGARSRVLVIGAGGGVGSLAVQIATARGAAVTGLCSAAKADLVRRLGAVDVIDRHAADVDRDGPVFDAVIDTAGNRPVSLLRRAITPRGALVLVGGDKAGGPLLGGFDRQLLAPLRAIGRPQRIVGLVANENAADLTELAGMVTDGAVRAVVDEVLPLARTAEAISRMADWKVRGKLVIDVTAG